MKIAVCDDEYVCVDRICTLINAYCIEKQLVCDCCTFTDPAVFHQSHMESYDVVFLDANMGNINGIAAAKALREVNTSAILVYVSGFVEYAPMGYSVDAFRYLMKHDLENSFAECMDEIVCRLTMNSKQLSISTIGGEQKFVISSLVFLESFRHQILVHLSDGREVESRQYSLAELTALLQPHSFIRIHRSFLVNPVYIETIKSRVVTLSSGQVLNCGKKDYAEIVRTFTLWKGGE